MKKIFAALALCTTLAPLTAFGQVERSYHYASIVYTIEVNADTTIEVEEAQTYAFEGEYHQAVRDIPHQLLDAITDIEVIDAETNVPLIYSNKRLDKNNPESWNRYTTYEDDGETYIEWYYNLADTQDPSLHTWLVRYKVHGALAFYKDHDELYWNLFTSYSVPVDAIEVFITLPSEVTSPTSSFYTSNNHEYASELLNNKTFHLYASDIAPGEAATFAVGWQKGLVDQGAYWRDFLHMYWILLASLAVLLGGVVAAIGNVFFIEHKNRGRGTIVPQYEPPQTLPPAMGEVVVRKRAGSAAWPSTIVDLAVRGFVTIEEQEDKAIFGLSAGKEYRVERTPKDANMLAQYEQEFLDALVPEAGSVFSTKEMKTAYTQKQKLFEKMQKATKTLYANTAQASGAFLIPPSLYAGSLFLVGAIAAGGFALFALVLSGALPSKIVQIFSLMGALIFSWLLVWYVRTYRPTLNREGHILREEWLGFKMYLETAEKYRMQNLTPDIFEKYLPYAMIFGVEKKWAHAFEGMNVPPPTWYHGAAYVPVGTGAPSGGSSFSPTAFSASFSSSFTSAFASSGGGGASGGGGGAGGGGGGGGGGAS